MIRDLFRRLFGVRKPEAVAIPAPIKPRQQPRIMRKPAEPDLLAIGENTFRPYTPPPGVRGSNAVAMDSGSISGITGYCGQSFGIVSNYINDGLNFKGYATLAAMMLRAEFRKPVEVIAKECTREWIKFKSKDAMPGEAQSQEVQDRIAELEAEFKRLRVREVVRRQITHGLAYGLGHIWAHVNDDALDTATQKDPLKINANGIKKGTVKRLVNVDPIWTNPNMYNADNPLRPDYFKPQTWWVQGIEVSATRLLTTVPFEVPDILKPAFNFGGLSLTQQLEAYVHNFLRTRQSVSDLVSNFATRILKTNMAGNMQSDAGLNYGDIDADSVTGRLQAMTAWQSNNGTFVLDKESEEFEVAQVSLAGLHELQAQSMEFQAGIPGIPLVKLFGLQPTGLGACLVGETMILTNRGQIPIRDVTLNDLVMTRNGWAPITFSGITKNATELFEIQTTCGIIKCTGNHPIWNASTNEFVPAENVQVGQRLLLIGENRVTQKTRRLWRGVVNGGGNAKTGIIRRGHSKQNDRFYFTEKFGKLIAEISRSNFMFTTLIEIKKTINFQILKLCMKKIIAPNTTLIYAQNYRQDQNLLFARNAAHCSLSQNFLAERNFAPASAFLQIDEKIVRLWLKDLQVAFALCVKNLLRLFAGIQNFALVNAQPLVKTGPHKRENTTLKTAKNTQGENAKKGAMQRVQFPESATTAKLNLFQLAAITNYIVRSVAKIWQPYAGVLSVRKIKANEPVYDLTVANGYLPEFFANGILVHNSSDGEIRVFYDEISGYQEANVEPSLTQIFHLAQLNLWGDIDARIEYEFIPLWQLSEKEAAEVEKVKADIDALNIQEGKITPDEARERESSDPHSVYAGINLTGAAPGPPDAGEFDPAESEPDPTKLMGSEE